MARFFSLEMATSNPKNIKTAWHTVLDWPGSRGESFQGSVANHHKGVRYKSCNALPGTIKVVNKQQDK